MSGTLGVDPGPWAPWDQVGNWERNPATTGNGGVVQLPLPPLRQMLRTDDARFAHPAERDFGKLLSFYHVRWAYEPTTFVLRRDHAGRAIEAFSPDFYLPDRRLYIELTTMRQPLVTRKNRKLRRLREIYPDVRIKLLYRRDVLRLATAYQHAPDRAPETAAGDVLASPGELARAIREMTERAVSEWEMNATRDQGRPVLLGLGPGAERFQRTLAQAFTRLGHPVDSGQVAVPRFQKGSPLQVARIVPRSAGPLAGRHVLIASDVVSTGLSLVCVLRWLEQQGVSGVRICTLLDRQGARLIDVPLDYVGMIAPEEPIGGFGLQLHRQFQGLPYLTSLRLI